MFYLSVLAPTLILQSLVFLIICFCAKDKVLKEWKIFLAPFLLSCFFSCGVFGATVIAVESFSIVHFASGCAYSVALLTAQFALFLCMLAKDGSALDLWLKGQSDLGDEPLKRGDDKISQNSLDGLILRNRSLQNQAKTGIDLLEVRHTFLEAQKIAKTAEDLQILRNADNVLCCAESGKFVKREDLSEAISSLFKILSTKNCKKISENSKTV